MIQVKSLSLISAAVLLCSVAHAQSEPSKPTYEKVVYENNGKTYVNAIGDVDDQRKDIKIQMQRENICKLAP